MFTALTAIKVVVTGLLIITGNQLIKNMTGSDIVDFAIEVLPQLKDLVLSAFDIFKMFFSIMPPHVYSIFLCFSSLMLIVVIYRLSKGGS